MTAAQADQQNNRDGSGRYQTKQHSEADVDLAPERTAAQASPFSRDPQIHLDRIAELGELYWKLNDEISDGEADTDRLRQVAGERSDALRMARISAQLASASMTGALEERVESLRESMQWAPEHMRVRDEQDLQGFIRSGQDRLLVAELNDIGRDCEPISYEEMVQILPEGTEAHITDVSGGRRSVRIAKHSSSTLRMSLIEAGDSSPVGDIDFTNPQEYDYRIDAAGNVLISEAGDTGMRLAIKPSHAAALYADPLTDDDQAHLSQIQEAGESFEAATRAYNSALRDYLAIPIKADGHHDRESIRQREMAAENGRSLANARVITAIDLYAATTPEQDPEKIRDEINRAMGPQLAEVQGLSADDVAYRRYRGRELMSHMRDAGAGRQLKTMGTSDFNRATAPGERLEFFGTRDGQWQVRTVESHDDDEMVSRREDGTPCYLSTRSRDTRFCQDSEGNMVVGNRRDPYALSIYRKAQA